MQFFLLLITFFAGMASLHATEFNTFKSYKDAKVKPPQYGKARKVAPDLSEYLTEEQVGMMKLRKSPSTAGHTFNQNWSGFKQQSRRLSVDPTAINNNLRGTAKKQ